MCTKRLALAGEKTSHAAMTMMSAKPAMKWTETSRRCGRRLARAADPSAMPETASAAQQMRLRKWTIWSEGWKRLTEGA